MSLSRAEEIAYASQIGNEALQLAYTLRVIFFNEMSVGEALTRDEPRPEDAEWCSSICRHHFGDDPRAYSLSECRKRLKAFLQDLTDRL